MGHNLRFGRHGALGAVGPIASGGMNAAKQVRAESRRVDRSAAAEDLPGSALCSGPALNIAFKVIAAFAWWSYPSARVMSKDVALCSPGAASRDSICRSKRLDHSAATMEFSCVRSMVGLSRGLVGVAFDEVDKSGCAPGQ